jgi:hypothetical protein
MIEATPILPKTFEEDSCAALPLIRAYLQELLSTFESPAVTETGTLGTGPETVFEILTSRQFSYLGRSKSALYRDNILTVVTNSMNLSRPIPFYYDIGGGYHAVSRQGGKLSFHVGLAELCLLSQIALFSKRVRSFYPPGVLFSLIIDNMCAFLVNDIPLTQTIRYAEELRELIQYLGLGHVTDVILESEHFSSDAFEQFLAEFSPPSEFSTLTEKQHNNVERFLGHPCHKHEAASRASRYSRIIWASEHLLATLIQGIHMTQRATPTTICFRPFPGGDSRVQCGEVVLTKNSKGKIYPVLMTNTRIYLCRSYQFPDLLPPLIPSITYAEQLRT